MTRRVDAATLVLDEAELLRCRCIRRADLDARRRACTKLIWLTLLERLPRKLPLRAGRRVGLIADRLALLVGYVWSGHRARGAEFSALSEYSHPRVGGLSVGVGCCVGGCENPLVGTLGWTPRGRLSHNAALG